MAKEFQFAVYEGGKNRMKRTTYRVFKVRQGYEIKRYESCVHEWLPVFEKKFKNLTEVFKSKQFKSLFTKNLED